MDAVLWVIAGVLAAVYLGAGITKLAQPKEKLRANKNLAWTEDYSAQMIKTIGALEVAAAVGLIVPPLIGIADFFAPLAALGLVLLMSGAILTHWRRGEKQVLPVPLVLGLLAAVVAWGRFGPYPFS